MKFGVYVALAGVLSALFALFPDRRAGRAAPHLPMVPPNEETVAPAPQTPGSGEQREKPAVRPVSLGGARVVVV